MSTFIQLHLLTSYPPANLNRDDLGRPKTAVMGGVQRLRVSSQSLKRAWRTSDLFEDALAAHVGTRTKEMGKAIYVALSEGRPLVDVLRGVEGKKALQTVAEKTAREQAKKIAAVFGKPEEKSAGDPFKDLKIKQLAHFGPDEVSAVADLVDRLRKSGVEPSDEDLELLRQKQKAVDVALFGRMLADAPKYNVEAAAQVAHAITVHKVAVEDDYFTAVDALNRGEEDMGAAHVDVAEFAAGLFYLYVCINRDLLVKNLQDDGELAKKTLRALTEAVATVAPTGKQNSFASRAYASYILAEKGARQPRSLSVAFLKPVSEKGDGMLANAVETLQSTWASKGRASGQDFRPR